MSKVVLACPRDSREGPRIEALIRRMSAELIPDNIEPAPTQYHREDLVQIAIINPVDMHIQHDMSILLGHIIGDNDGWWRPGAPSPDGAYGMFRIGKGNIELVADRLASRTLWYVKTDEVFIASTSQRAIVMLLGSYEPNYDAAVWMLSSGTLGPGHSWDRRLSSVEPDCTVSFDLESWSVRTVKRPAIFSADPLSHTEHRDRLAHSIDEVIRCMDLDYSNVVLPLSGGFDSRALLMMLKDKGLNKCVTWGLEASLEDTRNDAYIAGKVAKHFGVEHHYFVTDVDGSGETVDTIFRRFLVAGEGRVSRFSGYADGFAVWKWLHDTDVHGIIRGDMAFGVDPTSTEFETRRLCRLTLLSDFKNLPDAVKLDIPPQELGERFSRKPNETLETWRDRCYQTFAVPAVLAALTDLKAPYVEVINPLLSGSIVDCTRKHPDSLRTDKRLWKEILRERGPKIPYAETAAPAQVKLFLKGRGAVDVMLSELNSATASGPVNEYLIRFIKKNIQVSESLEVKRSWLRRTIRPFAPARIRGFTRRFQYKQDLDINMLAFRAFLVCKMSKMLSNDATTHK